MCVLQKRPPHYCCLARGVTSAIELNRQYATDGSSRKVVARDVRLPARSAPSLSPDGQWVAYGSSEPDKSGQIYLSRVDGSKTVAIETPHVAVGEPSLVKNASGRTLLAYTGLPSKGSNWRQLHIEDVTGKF